MNAKSTTTAKNTTAASKKSALVKAPSKGLTSNATMTNLMSVKAELNLSNSDIVGMVTQQVDETIRGHLRLIHGQINAKNAAHKALGAKVDKARQSMAEAATTSRREALGSFLKVWITGEEEIDAALSSISCRPVNKAVGAGFRWFGRLDCSYLSFSTSVDVRFIPSKEIEDYCDSQAKLLEELNVLTDKEGKLQRKLLELPSMERKAMAALTRHSLGTSSQGTAINNLISDIVGGLGLGLNEILAEEIVPVDVED